jgi:hypothetical protein
MTYGWPAMVSLLLYEQAVHSCLLVRVYQAGGEEQLSRKDFFLPKIALHLLLRGPEPTRQARPLFLKMAFTAGMLLWAYIAVSPATAVTVQYSFTGTVNQVSPRLSSTFITNPSPTAMSGLITVDSTDTNTASAILGSYTITNFSLNIGGYTATMGTSGNVVIRNGPPGTDWFNVTVNAPNGPVVSGLAPRIFEIQLRGPNSIFTSDALPPSSPSMTSFTNRNLWRLVFGAGTTRTVSGVMTAVTPVPLPPTAILFGAALVALVGLGAGNWKQRSAGSRRQGEG